MVLTREQAIDKLIKHDMQLIKDESKNWEEQSETLYQMLKHGLFGYACRSIKELEMLLIEEFNQEIEVV